MITALVGVPGQGKSFHAVSDFVVPELPVTKTVKDTKFVRIMRAIFKNPDSKEKEYRYIVTNIPINKEELEKDGYDTSYIIVIEDTDDRLAFSTVSDFEDHLHLRVGSSDIGPLFIVDECHKVFPTNKTAGLSVDQELKQRQELEHFFKEHRRNLCDVVLITQDYKDVNRSIIGNTASMYKMLKMNHFKSVIYKNKYKISYYAGLPKRSNEKPLHSEVKDLNPRIFDYYKSHVATGKEAENKNSKSLFFNKYVFLTMALFGYCFYKLFMNSPISDISKPDIDNKPNRFSTPVLSNDNDVPEIVDVCTEVPFQDYEFSYAYNDSRSTYFLMYKNSIKDSSLISSTQLILLGYRLSGTYFSDVKNILIEEKKTDTYYPSTSPTKASLRKKTKDYWVNVYSGYDRATIYSTKLTHESCDTYSYIVFKTAPVSYAYDYILNGETETLAIPSEGGAPAGGVTSMDEENSGSSSIFNPFASDKS